MRIGRLAPSTRPKRMMAGARAGSNSAKAVPSCDGLARGPSGVGFSGCGARAEGDDAKSAVAGGGTNAEGALPNDGNGEWVAGGGGGSRTGRTSNATGVEAGTGGGALAGAAWMGGPLPRFSKFAAEASSSPARSRSSTIRSTKEDFWVLDIQIKAAVRKM